MSQLLIETQCFPPLSFFVAALQEGRLLLEAQEHYVKGSYRNRFHIAGPNGLQRLSIPLAGGKHQQQPIQEVKIADVDDWQIRLCRSLKTAYGKSPFFIHYEDEIMGHIFGFEQGLFQWNLLAIELCLDLLGLDLPIELTTTFERQVDGDIRDGRNQILPKKTTFWVDLPQYPQVFQEKHGFFPNLSILDIIFCQGPQAGILLQKAAKK